MSEPLEPPPSSVAPEEVEIEYPAPSDGPGWYRQPDGQSRFWNGSIWVRPWEDSQLPSFSKFQVIDPAELAKQISDARQRATIMLLSGVAFLGAGLAITAMSYGSATPGGTYVVAVGPALFGVYLFIRGLFHIIRPAGLIQY